MRVLIALGGNAFINPTSGGSIQEQISQAGVVLKNIVRFIADGHKVIITHGNGYQVGNVLTRTECAEGRAYDLPLYIADAQTQGELGSIIEQNLINQLSRAGINRRTVTILTHVLVGTDDPSFKNPTKPIGNFYTQEEKRRHAKDGETWIEDSGRGYRKVVASPKPQDILEKDVIKELFEIGTIVIACGGGGIPVIAKNTEIEGIDCVIDKDLASALLAYEVGIDRFIIVTGVERVALNYKKPNQAPIDKINVPKLQKFLDEGQFPPGNMGPKIQSAVNFLQKNPRGEVIITSFEKLYEAFYSGAGTCIFP